MDYYKNNYEYIKVFQYLYQHNKEIEQERDLKKVSLLQNNLNISLEE
jgi:hypothetical protein